MIGLRKISVVASSVEPFKKSASILHELAGTEHGKMLFDTMIKVCQSKRVASLVVTHDLNLVHEFNLRQVTIMHNGNFKQEKS